MNIEIKKEYFNLEIISVIIVYCISIGYIFENNGLRTVNLSKIINFLQHFNFGFLFFKKILALIKYYFIKIIINIFVFIILFLFKLFKLFNFFKILFILFKYINKILKKLIFLKRLNKNYFKLNFLIINKINFRLYLIFKFILFLINVLFSSLHLTQNLFQWFFIKYLVKRQWITGETTLFYISHFVLHHYFLQFLIDLSFFTIELLYGILQKKRFPRSFHTYFFIYIAFTQICIHLIGLIFAFNGNYSKNLYFFSEAVTLNLGDSPNKNNILSQNISNKYFLSERDLIDPKPNKK